MRSLFAALLVLAAVPLFGAAKGPPRDVLPELTHERIDYWVSEFSTDKDYHKKIAEGFERKAPPAAPKPETPKGDSKDGKP